MKQMQLFIISVTCYKAYKFCYKIGTKQNTVALATVFCFGFTELNFTILVTVIENLMINVGLIA